MKKHKFIAAVLSLCLISGAASAINYSGYSNAVTDETYTFQTYGDFRCKKYSSGYIEITMYNGTDTVVTVPSEFEGVPVTSIGPQAFYGDSAITDIILPDTITEIGDYAFEECSLLI